MAKVTKGHQPQPAQAETSPAVSPVSSGPDQDPHLLQVGVMALVDSSTDLVVITRLDGQVIFMNPAGLAMVGLVDGAAMGQTTLADYFEDGRLAHWPDVVVPTVLERGSWQGRMDLRALQTGQRLPMGVNITLIRHPQTGQPLGLGVVGREMGLRQRLNTRHRHLETQLQASHDRLAEANRELSRAARLKDEFVATMSHELRTPLSSILGMAQALRHEVYGSLTDRQHHAIGIIERSGRHLLTLINDVLDLAKIEAGTMDLRLAPLTLRHLCDNSLAFVQQRAHQKHIQISVHLNEAPDQIEADERRLKQALISLLDNAVKFTPVGGQVRLTITPDPDPASPITRLRFTVADTGPGIAPADYGRLFESFVQLDGSFSREHGGTGLGLALVKRIAEMHGGRVTVESQLGQGSQFTLYIPCPALSPPPRGQGP